MGGGWGIIHFVEWHCVLHFFSAAVPRKTTSLLDRLADNLPTTSEQQSNRTAPALAGRVYPTPGSTEATPRTLVSRKIKPRRKLVALGRCFPPPVVSHAAPATYSHSLRSSRRHRRRPF